MRNNSKFETVFTNSCICHTSVTGHGIDYKLPEDDK
jgi:hypothetical protein